MQLNLPVWATAGGGPAFPVHTVEPVGGEVRYLSTGMTLRDYFAGQALAGMLAAAFPGEPPFLECTYVAHKVYEYADAVLAERAKKGEG